MTSDIGRLVGVSAIWALRKHDSYYDVPWRTRPGAGPVLTNLIHDVDSLRYICGEIAEVSAFSSSAVRGHAVEDTASVGLRFENGALGSILITDAGQSPWAWEVNSEENPDYPVTAVNSVFFTGTVNIILILCIVLSIAFVSWTRWKEGVEERTQQGGETRANELGVS